MSQIAIKDIENAKRRIDCLNKCINSFQKINDSAMVDKYSKELENLKWSIHVYTGNINGKVTSVDINRILEASSKFQEACKNGLDYTSRLIIESEEI
ncbi:hypothetical protein E4665_12370 [Sporolactobacillus shoreae]|uniref:Uncharacterized protein n=1 Tax=Sporolactobacillus shoreae TaxID=1465501 RepID=A0A4Z0GNC5_9BACL|nr:hypothetical protein [Sporolactobacillus shoreae]TGA97414.1 hypothetical protein E4665_12370 [Sporolactobacillus shoreae]